MNKNSVLEELLDSFDFEKVYKVMKFLNWTWWSEGKNEVPSVRQMELRVIDLFNTVWHNVVDNGVEDFVIATGGFEVYGYKTDNETTPFGFTIKFILEEIEL